jgi:hypothetical protein
MRIEKVSDENGRLDLTASPVGGGLRGHGRAA